MAEEFLNSSEFDLVVCDYFMPECDGKSALDSLGKMGKKGKMVLTSSYPLDIELKKTDNFTFVDKLSLLDWIAENHAAFQYI
jgi:CheY-like chemotaxis protein